MIKIWIKLWIIILILILVKNVMQPVAHTCSTGCRFSPCFVAKLNLCTNSQRNFCAKYSIIFFNAQKTAEHVPFLVQVREIPAVKSARFPPLCVDQHHFMSLSGYFHRAAKWCSHRNCKWSDNRCALISPLDLRIIPPTQPPKAVRSWIRSASADSSCTQKRTSPQLPGRAANNNSHQWPWAHRFKSIVKGVRPPQKI